MNPPKRVPGGALRVERRIFAGVGAFLVPWTIIYVLSSDDRAGGLLLAACAVALLAFAAFLSLSSRGTQPRPEDDTEAPVPTWEPHEEPAVSLWPVVIGAAATGLGVGLAFTVWVAAPAGILLVVGVLGYARESTAGSEASPRSSA